MEQLTPLFSCKSLDAVLKFYQALGFAVTYQQEAPYLYAAVQRGSINVHFTKGTGGATCLVHVPDVSTYHHAFADGLRSAYGTIPTADTPRITRWRQGQTRFQTFDPAGNILLFINHDEPDPDYDAYDDTLSPMMQALQNVIFLRDTYADDKAAAKFLDKKLKQIADVLPLDRARALAARAELAVALGEDSQPFGAELTQIALSPGEREQYRDELLAAERLERWKTQAE